jgi:hypothetical protein
MSQELAAIDLRPLWDDRRVLRNPHKGWYHHYYDNGLKRYGASLAEGDFLEDFPGLNHLYLRLAWSYLQPEENRFDWDVIDRVIEPWTAHGYRIAFRVTSKETSDGQAFATPEWVKNKGAKGEFFTHWGRTRAWEPDYGDPIFLDCLDRFHAAFAERYDAKPWLEYVDVGSYGDWGEGHTVPSSKRAWPVDVIRRHVEIYRRHYKHAVLMANDDFITVRPDTEESKRQLLDLFVKEGLAFRDDSVSVSIYSNGTRYNTLQAPALFEHFWPAQPIDLELDHYHATKENKTFRSGLPLLAATEDVHATYVGFHGDAREFLRENPDVAERLANKAGYWFFLRQANLPGSVQRGGAFPITLAWENRGCAPAYHRYVPVVRLTKTDDPGVSLSHRLERADCRKWAPGRVVEESATLAIPAGLPDGTYHIQVGLFEEAPIPRAIQIGFAKTIEDPEGFYTVAQVTIR